MVPDYIHWLLGELKDLPPVTMSITRKKGRVKTKIGWGGDVCLVVLDGYTGTERSNYGLTSGCSVLTPTHIASGEAVNAIRHMLA